MQTVNEIISSFDRLPPAEQKELTRQILLRNLDIDTPAVSDEELILAAEAIFLELDEREAVDARA